MSTNSYQGVPQAHPQSGNSGLPADYHQPQSYMQPSPQQANYGGLQAGVDTGQYGSAGMFSAYQSTLMNSSFDIRYDVQVVPQLTGFSCWAAGFAMIVGWRDRMSIDPSEIARAAGAWSQYKNGLHPEDVRIMTLWGFVPEPPMTYTVQGFVDLLKQYGPLWVASAEPGPHIRVVVGIYGDGSADGTKLIINDPWDKGAASFSPNFTGSQYEETYREFVAKQSTLAGQEMNFEAPIYVAHLPNLPNWVQGQSYGMPVNHGMQPPVSNHYTGQYQQQVPPYAQAADAAVAGAVIAGAGLTWQVLTQVFNSGDVTYQVLKMNGAKYPEDDKNTYGDPPYPYKEGKNIQAQGWRQSWQGDLVGMYFDIRWFYNDHAVRAVEMVKRKVEGAWTKWSLKHETSLVELPSTFIGKHGKYCSAVRITNTYEWRHWLWGSKIAREEILLYGDGDSSRSFKWIQD